MLQAIAFAIAGHESPGYRVTRSWGWSPFLLARIVVGEQVADEVVLDDNDGWGIVVVQNENRGSQLVGYMAGPRSPAPPTWREHPVDPFAVPEITSHGLEQVVFEHGRQIRRRIGRPVQFRR